MRRGLAARMLVAHEMTADKRRLLFINLIGGLAVLASYAYCLAANPATRSNLWGGVPSELRAAYTVSMLLATTGYFAFTYFVLRRVDSHEARVAGVYPYRLFLSIYAGILLPSALWMPLTFRMFVEPAWGLWIGIRLVLAIVGISSLTLLWAVATVRPAGPAWARAAAVAGALAFSVQTALLDALVWPYYFPLPS